MSTLRYSKKLRLYLIAPQIMTLMFLVGALGLCAYDLPVGVAVAGVTIIYAVVVYIISRELFARLEKELLAFAAHYGTVQNEILENFSIPYALINDAGKIVWMNNCFCEVTGKEKNYSKSITSIFGEITRESIARAKGESLTYHIEFSEKNYCAVINRIDIDAQMRKDELIHLVLDDGPLLSFMLVDETDLIKYRKLNIEQRLVCAMVYIDNYDETFDAVEDMQRSILSTVVDRKINNYFKDAGAVIRKLESDKYFVIFEYKNLDAMELDRFSLLEDVKTIKSGNENEITLSIGIGLNGDSYLDTVEYARNAIGLALGRGGSQAVIKDREEVSYYGMRGKEVSRNTRVKARVRAQALRELMLNHEKVIVMGHQISDADAVGAAIGVFCAARELEKECHIVLNTISASIRPFVDLFVPEAGYPYDMFVKSHQALDMLTPETLVMVVDTNRPNYTECPELLVRSKNIVVFDHHRQSKEKIEAPILSYIEPYASSTCEMIAEVLQYFSEKIHLKNCEADCIYGGILIDTNNFLTKTGVRTFEAAAYLRRSGVDVVRVRKLLREDMEAYKARAEIVRKAKVYRKSFAISICRARELESPTVIGAQASNELLNIIGIKASFVMTEFKGKIYVSARSIDEIDVQLVMERLGGGGHLNVAGAQIENSSVEEVGKKIEDIIDIMIDEGEIKL